MGRTLKNSLTVGQLAAGLGLELHGSPNINIDKVESADLATGSDFCFAKNSTWSEKVNGSAILLSSNIDYLKRSGPAILSNEPRLDFARALNFIDKFIGFRWSAADPIIHPTARIGKNVFLGRGVRIGADTVVYHNAVIGDEVEIGERCVIKSCAVIGEDGFGFERDSNGKAVRLTHIGTVIIGDDVEIGSLTTVCRGTLGNTILRNGCKIDDHVHLAHNVDIGEDAFIIACAEVSGGVKIGQRAWVAPNATVMNQVSIGSDAVVGLGAVVLKSVPINGVVVGNPAKPINR
jgi:UDP-3-O-[3-hydroxymyristoyl] glucosamine N-acyltransferase